ncbi:MAG: outer membrane protein transport protein [Rariglobus sp.]
MKTPHHRTPSLPALTVGSAALAALLLPALAFANGTRLPNQNAEATARGNAFVATADNPSAIYYNPAGLTQLPGLQVQAESYIINARYDYRSPAGSNSKAKRDYAIIPQFYTTFTPENSPLSYGLGAYAPFGQASEWPDDSGFSTIATRNEITFITIAPTIAWKISDELSIGAGLQVNQVETDLRRNVPGGEFRFEGDDTSFGYNIGILWKLNERHVFGLNYQSRSTSHFKGDASIDAFGLSFPGSVDLPFPDVIALGYSWRPTPGWNLEFAVDRTNWDLLNTATLESGFGPNPIPFDWEASYYYVFGVTRYLRDGWRVSAGYTYSENSVPSATFNPAVPDMNRHLASIGVGRTIGAMSFFFTYQHGFKASRNVTGSPTSAFLENADGRYESAIDAINLSGRYSF